VAEWIVVTYRVPPEPSRHRVAIWRELRRVGAVSLQQAAWIVPDRPEFVEAVDRALALVDRAGGEALVLDADPRDEAMAARLEAMFTEAREEEWTEFIADCGKFQAEIRKEFRKRKFTAAELEEEEQSLERLRRWFSDLRRRDLFVAPAALVAEGKLKECAERLEDFAERVYREGGKR
jgi:ChrB-like protein